VVEVNIKTATIQPIKLKGENGGNKVNRSNEKNYRFELNDTVGNWLVERMGIVL